MNIKIIGLFLCSLLLVGCNERQFNGYVEGENIYLASPYSGVLQQLMVRRGQAVTQGALLFSLDPNPQKLNIIAVQGELEQAKNTLVDLVKPRRDPELLAIEAQIKQSEAQIALAEVRVLRFQKLYNKNATDKDTLDAALINLKNQKEQKALYESNLSLAKLGARSDQINAQKSAIKSLQAKSEQALWELAQKTMHAPDSGVIFDTYYRPGEFVAAMQPVVSLLTPNNIRIEFFVPLDYLSKLKVGQKIHFDCVGCAKKNEAQISYISPEAEYLPPLVYSRDNDSKIVFRIKAQIKNPTLFKPGQPVMVTCP